MNQTSKPVPKQMPTLLKMLIDFGPLLLFFIVDELADIFVATGALLVACTLAFLVSWKMVHKIPVIASASLIFVLIFGGLTLWLGDEEFIKIEVSVTNALCGIILVGGVLLKQSLLKVALGDMVELEDEGWATLSWTLGLFLIAIAITNEIVRLNTTTDIWITFRVYGILALNALFFASQIPIIKRHMIVSDDETPTLSG